MRAAAELAGEAVHLDDAHDVAVLLAEEHHRAELARLVDRRQERAHRPVLEDALVDDLLDALALLPRERLRVREVEAELVGPNGRARLAHVVAEHVLERLVQEVGRGVVGHRREAHLPGDDRAHPVAGGEALALEEERLVVAEAVGGDELGAGAVLLDPALVADLAAALRVERRLAQLGEEEPVSSSSSSAPICVRTSSFS